MPTGEFDVEAIGRLDETERHDHILVLKSSALAITSFGSDRRRGLGWVSVEHESGSMTAAELSRLVAMQAVTR